MTQLKSLNPSSSARRMCLVVLIFTCSASSMAQFPLGPANQNWASRSAPVRLTPNIGGSWTIEFNPAENAGIPSVFCNYIEYVGELGMANVILAAQRIKVYLPKYAQTAVVVIRVRIQDARNPQSQGERTYYFYSGNPVVVTADDIVTYGTAGAPLFTQVVTDHVRYVRLGGGLAPYLNPQPTVWRLVEVSKPAGSTGVFQKSQCRVMQTPFLGFKKCEAISINPDVPGVYKVKFTLSDVSGYGESEGYWVTWTHYSFHETF